MEITLTIKADDTDIMTRILAALKAATAEPVKISVSGPSILLCQSTKSTQPAASQAPTIRKLATDPFELVKSGWHVQGPYLLDKGLRSEHRRIHIVSPTDSHKYKSYRIGNGARSAGITEDQLKQLIALSKAPTKKESVRKEEATTPSDSVPANPSGIFTMQSAAQAALAPTESDKQALLIGIVCNHCDGKVIKEVKNYRFKLDDAKKAISQHYTERGHTSYSSKRVA